MINLHFEIRLENTAHHKIHNPYFSKNNYRIPADRESCRQSLAFDLSGYAAISDSGLEQEIFTLSLISNLPF